MQYIVFMCLTWYKVLLWSQPVNPLEIMNTSKEIVGFCKLFATIIQGLRFEMKAESTSPIK